MNCICDQYRDPCRHPPTQEDLLCDACRPEDERYFACALLTGFGIEPTHVKVPEMLNLIKEMEG